MYGLVFYGHVNKMSFKLIVEGFNMRGDFLSAIGKVFKENT